MPKDTIYQRSGWKRLIVGSLLAFAIGCASTPKAPPPVPATSANVGNTTIVAIAPAPGSSRNMSLPEFLGFPKFASGVGGILQRLGSRLLKGLDLTGRFPGLQPQPPVLALTDPENMKESAPPAVQAAAEVKAEEDAAPQKIMAIRYLATLGCGGCYEKVENALLEGLSDCTEEVRFEAAKALGCKPDCGCKFCYSTSCCSANVRKKLEELSTCEKEPSARVRRLARISLACCATVPLKSQDEVPREGPTEAAAPAQGPVVTNREFIDQLSDDIQLVSFEALLAPSSASGLILANVNGEHIYENQVIPLVEVKLRRSNRSSLQTFDSTEKRNLVAAELQRVIDWKLLEQFARNEVYSAGTNGLPVSISPQEIKAWFERKVQIDSTVFPHHILAHYEVHRNRYQMPAKVRWERLSILIDRCKNREQALAVADYLKNRAVGGAMQLPSGLSRDIIESQTFGWCELAKVEPGFIRAGLIDLQVGQMSPTIEDNNRLHLVRVLERTIDDVLPLPMVADAIRLEILSERRKAAEAHFFSQMRTQSQIWTYFDMPTNTIQSSMEAPLPTTPPPAMPPPTMPLPTMPLPTMTPPTMIEVQAT